MDALVAQQLANRLRISMSQVVREEYELLLLRGLLESEIGSQLVFKGGTALRLAFGSPRFSDDLDFSALTPIRARTFSRIAQVAVASVGSLTLVEALSKRFTLFSLYRIHEPYLQAFSIKVEISTRPQTWKSGVDYELRLLTSDVTNISALGQVATLERLWQDKQQAFANRHEPRDLYDLWFIAQKLKRPFDVDASAIDRKTLKRELHKYLPQSQWRVLEQWSK